MFENQEILCRQTLKTRFIPQSAERKNVASEHKTGHDLSDQCLPKSVHVRDHRNAMISALHSDAAMRAPLHLLGLCVFLLKAPIYQDAGQDELINHQPHRQFLPTQKYRLGTYFVIWQLVPYQQ